MPSYVSMVDMAKTPQEVKEDVAATAPPAQGNSVPKYPYGLCLCLEDDALDKLGLSGDLPDVGDTIEIAAMAKVTSASRNAYEQDDGTSKECSRIELQIVKMGIPAATIAEQDDERVAARRKSWYAKGADDNDGDEAGY